MKNWLLWMVVGVVSIIGGVVALFNPLAASLTVEWIAAWTFLVSGILQIISAFRATGFGAKLWAILGGVVGAVIGVSLLNNPLQGMVTLTMLVAVLFLMAGVAKVLTSIALRATPFFVPVLVSGVLSVALALMIFSNFPASAVQILGVMLAVELISNGVALISLALRRKQEAPNV